MKCLDLMGSMRFTTAVQGHFTGTVIKGPQAKSPDFHYAVLSQLLGSFIPNERGRDGNSKRHRRSGGSRISHARIANIGMHQPLVWQNF